MTDILVHAPEPGHTCDVGWSERQFRLPGGPADTPTAEPVWATIRGQYDPPGAVRRCEVCGTYWRAIPFQQPYSGRHTAQRIEWVRESWIRRWWRERKAARP